MYISLTLIAFTRLAVLFATSLALCTNCLLATGLLVLPEAIRHALHKADVCLATTVAADNTCEKSRLQLLQITSMKTADYSSCR